MTIHAGRRTPSSHIIAANNPAVVPGSSHFGDMIMADYHAPTVIQQTIPKGDITPLEPLHVTDSRWMLSVPLVMSLEKV